MPVLGAHHLNTKCCNPHVCGSRFCCSAYCRKPEYAPDVRRLEKFRMLHTGSVLVADNVICPGAPALLEYLGVTPWTGWDLECADNFLETRPERKEVYESTRWSTRLLECNFEYRPDQPDAMSVSIYK